MRTRRPPTEAVLEVLRAARPGARTPTSRLEAVAEGLGARVRDVRLPCARGSALLRGPRIRPLVILDAALAGEPRRRALAEAIGHLWLTGRDGPLVALEAGLRGADGRDDFSDRRDAWLEAFRRELLVAVAARGDD